MTDSSGQLDIQSIKNTFLSVGAENSFLAESGDSWSERFAGVFESSSGITIHIFSDGWDLQKKTLVEKKIQEAILLKTPNPCAVTVYFKRKTSKPNAPVTPRSPQEVPAPFGAKIARRAIPGVRSIVAVSSGKGGVGKSTVSVNLAVAMAAAGSRVGILDADIYGPSIAAMTGTSGPMDVRIHGTGVPKAQPVVAHGIKIASFGYFTDVKEPAIWRGPMASKALEQLMYDVDWGDLDVLVLDLPPGTGDIQLTIIEKLPVTAAVIVSTPQDIALIDAHKAVSMFEKLEVPIIGIVRNMAHFSCSRCGHDEHIFGDAAFSDFAQTRRIPEVASLPLTIETRQLSDAGRPVALFGSDKVKAPFQGLAKLVLECLK